MSGICYSFPRDSQFCVAVMPGRNLNGRQPMFLRLRELDVTVARRLFGREQARQRGGNSSVGKIDKTHFDHPDDFCFVQTVLEVGRWNDPDLSHRPRR